MSMSFSEITAQVGAAVAQTESDLKAKIDGYNSSNTTPTTAELMELQRAMQAWSMLVELQSTLIKTTAETMKGIIQKSG